MNPEENFFNIDNLNESGEKADVLDVEPQVIEEYPAVGGYNRDDLRNAIREARD